MEIVKGEPLRRGS